MAHPESQGPAAFPSTQWSMILEAQRHHAPDYRRGLERLVHAYWHPIYVYIHRAWGHSSEEAKDLTQEFLVHLLQADSLAGYERDRGRFRSYLKGALRHFLSNEAAVLSCKKRGGDQSRIPLEGAWPEITDVQADPATLFDRAWAQALMEQALERVQERLKTSGQEISWQAFRLYELDPADTRDVSYRAVADQLHLSEQEVKSRLAYVRHLLREALYELARDTVSTEMDVQTELREIFE